MYLFYLDRRKKPSLMACSSRMMMTSQDSWTMSIPQPVMYTCTTSLYLPIKHQVLQSTLFEQVWTVNHVPCFRSLEEVSVEGNGQRLVKRLRSPQEKQMRRAWNLLYVVMGFSFVPSICSGAKSLPTPCTSKSKWPVSQLHFLQWMWHASTGLTSRE